MSVAPSLFTKGDRIGLSPLSARNMDPADKAALEKRAAAMGVVVSTFTRSGKGYMVRVHGSRTTELVARGPLAAIIAGALDDHAESGE